MTDCGPLPFDLLGPLPTGRLAIEASAGTGKTYTLAALATRLIAEGRAVASELLMVTFTRAATGELRSRVRSQLVEAAAVLGGRADLPEGDELLGHLMADDRQRRLARVERAVTEFDAATIATIHGFASQARGILGLSSEMDTEAELVGDDRTLVLQVCADVLAAASTTLGAAAGLPTLTDLVALTTGVAGRPDVAVEPHSADQGATDGLLHLRQLVVHSVAELERRHHLAGVLSYDDVLVQLQRALRGRAGSSVGDALRGRYAVALIDEFQDTDPVQWEIFSALFGRPGDGTTLILVGDPKQAIYRFRGADIGTYLAAVQDPTTARASLTTNWRSDGALVGALDVLLDGVTFGDRDIRFETVHAAEPHRHQRLRAPDGAPLASVDLRLAVGPGIDRNRSGRVAVPAAAAAIEHDLVRHVRSLLGRAILPTESALFGAGGSTLSPSDVAVLVGTADQGLKLQRALLAEGVPAVLAADDPVTSSPAAEQLAVVLRAVERPGDPRVVRAFALSWFGGWTAEQVAVADDVALAPLQEMLSTWAALLATRSVADVLARVWSDTGVVARVLGQPDGDRNVTDLDHLAELLHGAAPHGRAAVAGLLALLAEFPEEPDDGEAKETVDARRIESQADAVQIMTIWKAKGLEFPVVCVPYLWRPKKSTGPLFYTDPATDRRSVDLDNSAEWPDPPAAAARKALAETERYGEQLRILYVALTRARHQVVVWWADADSSAKTALAHVLFGRKDGQLDEGQFLQEKVTVPDDDTIVDWLEPLRARAGDAMAVRAIDDLPPATTRWSDPARFDRQPDLSVARFVTTPDRSTQRWSFSLMTRSATDGIDPFDSSLSDGGAGDEGDRVDDMGVDDLGVDDPGLDEPTDGVPVDAGRLAPLPAGPVFGTLVHAVLEEVDFTAPDLGAEVEVALDRQLDRVAFDLTPQDPTGGEDGSGRALLVDGLVTAIGCPLGPALGDVRLADLGPTDRLNELAFDLRLGGSGRHATGSDIGALVLAHLPAGDPLRPWADGVANGSIDVELAGSLTGSIDLVARLTDRHGSPRFVVADYKSNLLTPRGHPPHPDDYGQTAMATAMAEHHYPLQALIYSVAVHRYLRWRLGATYRPADHLGGAAYLFVRGMTGGVDDRGRPRGVFHWSVPPLLVGELSDLLDGRSPVRGAA